MLEKGGNCPGAVMLRAPSRNPAATYLQPFGYSTRVAGRWGFENLFFWCHVRLGEGSGTMGERLFTRKDIHGSHTKGPLESLLEVFDSLKPQQGAPRRFGDLFQGGEEICRAFRSRSVGQVPLRLVPEFDEPEEGEGR